MICDPLHVLDSCLVTAGGGALASYWLFETGFVQALIAMGESDALQRKAELLAFFADP